MDTQGQKADGWLVVETDDEGSGCPWQLAYRHRGAYLALEYWFPTEKKAYKWIRKHLLMTVIVEDNPFRGVE